MLLQGQMARGGGINPLPASASVYTIPAPNASTSFSFPSTVNNNISLVGAEAAYERGYFGTSVTIAMIGVGIRTDHTAFGSRVVSGMRVLGLSLTTGVADEDGSGTHIAGLIAGRRAGGNRYFPGIARDARIMPVDIATVSGGAINVVGSVTAALEYAVTNSVQIINYEFNDVVNVTVSIRRSSDDFEWRTPAISELLISIDAELNGNPYSTQASVYGNELANADVVVVADTGSNSINGNVPLITMYDMTNGGAVSPGAQATWLGTGRLARRIVVGSNVITLGSNTNLRDVLVNGFNGPTGLFQNAPIFDPRLRSKFLVVAAVTVGSNSTVLVANSNGCGSSKEWCVVAPVHIAVLPTRNGNTNYGASTANETKYAAGLVSGALALLKSRLPSMPMVAIRELLLRTTDNVGDAGTDSIYGRGMINVGRAITLQGNITVLAPSNTSSSMLSSSYGSSSFLLSQSDIDLSPAFRSLGYQVNGISIAAGFEDFQFNMPFSSILKGNASQSNLLGFGLLAKEQISTNTRSIGGFGLRTNSSGKLVDFDLKRKRVQLNYALCASGCNGSVWDEYKLEHEPLPFFADTERKLSSGWKVNDHMGAFVVLGLDEDNSYDKYSQYGINWTGINLGNWEFAGSFSSIQEQQGYVLGSKFNGAYAVGETTSNQIGLRAQRYIEGWRLFGGVEYGRTQVDALSYSSVRSIDDLRYAGWRFGIDKDSVLRANDKLHLGCYQTTIGNIR